MNTLTLVVIYVNVYASGSSIYRRVKMLAMTWRGAGVDKLAGFENHALLTGTRVRIPPSPPEKLMGTKHLTISLAMEWRRSGDGHPTIGNVIDTTSLLR